ncbi:hypothetical protein [Qaidamihabitans albus]|uniref:hypothetical protein n=1 Tax=Qaidamihabitans albus TaxID=2795733 RepID=UPI0018F14156|nr:hypothetical protein [Qaidamihabitans albus]
MTATVLFLLLMMTVLAVLGRVTRHGSGNLLLDLRAGLGVLRRLGDAYASHVDRYARASGGKS